MEPFFTWQHIETSSAHLKIVMLDYILTAALMQQLLVTLTILLASLVMSRRLAPKVSQFVKRWGRKNFAYLTGRIHLSAREVLLLLIAPLLLGLATMVAAAATAPNGVLNVAASLMGAWAVIRLGSGVIRSSTLSKVLAICLCSVAVLNMLGWLQPTIDVLDKATISTGPHPISLYLILKGSFTLALLLWLARLATEWFERIMWRSKTISPAQKVLFAKLARVAFIAVAIMLGLNAVGIDFTALAVFGGAVGIGVGFGLQKVFSNLISGFILLMDKSIKPGDVIAIGDSYGWVNHIGARYVSILTRDGKEHLIPNEKLITDQVENWSYSDDNIRIHIPIHVSYDADRLKVKQLLLEVVEHNPRILKSPEPTCLIQGFDDYGVNFEIRAWIEDPVNGIANVRSSIYEAVWDAFKANHIHIPFPQRDLHLKFGENAEMLRELVELMREKK